MGKVDVVADVSTATITEMQQAPAT